ncbi:uncharacterized protein FMAN_09809 [Fusarium mangiferae]|uniref:PPPDE domain-containing protein n=1 Tax=Fusarium mangiferae TaxID=192010 RepID=A0A1L7TY64_FUSMA|nr:uncharacterized protein FMAN_09809 [Fusarium mangiferae]CVL00317.1 uncharacterized protein FMAN_09809 [Fusarium mangiferae]
MEPQKNTLRHITIFTVPAGTPVPISGSAYLGRYIKASSIQHWGIYVETEQDVQTRQGLCVELGRSSDDGIIVLHRTRQRREETEPQAGIKYEKTRKFTSWDNDSIVQCGRFSTTVERSWIVQVLLTVIEATTLCTHELYENYSVFNRNCQTFINLLVQRIMAGESAWTPRRTTSYVLTSGPSSTKVVNLWESDGAKSKALKPENTYQAPDWTPSPIPGQPPIQKTSWPVVTGPMGRELAMSGLSNKDPVSLEEQRKYEHELCRTWKTGSIPRAEPTATTGTFEVPIGMRQKVDARTKSMEWTYDSMAATSRRAYALGTNLDGYRNNKHISPSRFEEKQQRTRDTTSAALRERRTLLTAQIRDSKTQTPKVTREDLTDPVALSSQVTNLVETLKIPRSPFILKLLLDQLATDKGGPAWKEVRQKLRLALEEEIPKCKEDEKGALQNALQVLS